jgi:hypothetical protein
MMPYPYPGHGAMMGAVPYAMFYPPDFFVYPLPVCPCAGMMPPNYLYSFPYSPGAPWMGWQGGEDSFWFYSLPQTAPAVPVTPEGMEMPEDVPPDVLQWYGAPAPRMGAAMRVFKRHPAAGAAMEMGGPHMHILKVLPGAQYGFAWEESRPLDEGTAGEMFQFETAPAPGLEL